MTNVLVIPFVYKLVVNKPDILWMSTQICCSTTRMLEYMTKIVGYSFSLGLLL